MMLDTLKTYNKAVCMRAEWRGETVQLPSLSRTTALDPSLPVFLPGNHRNWDEVRGQMRILSDGRIEVVLDNPRDAEQLAEQMEHGLLVQMAFDYRMPVDERLKMLKGFPIEEPQDMQVEETKCEDSAAAEMRLAIDEKYGDIYVPNGKFEDGEPIFILRARDAYAPKAIERYADLCATGESPFRHSQAVRKVKKKFLAWQKEHGMKYPD